MNDAITTAIQSVLERVMALSLQDVELRQRLRALAQAYLADGEELPAVAQQPAAAEAVAIEVAAPAAPAPPTPPARLVLPAILGNPQVVREERHEAATLAVTDADLPLIEQRCRLKAEAARWAGTREQRLRDGVDFRTEIAPIDAELIARARALPDCFLWMWHPDGPSPSDPSQWSDVAGCFEVLASAVNLVRSLLDDSGAQADRLDQAMGLLAEAQSALRVIVEEIGGRPDTDQTKVYYWLKATTFTRQVYLARYMRLEDPADPNNWSDLNDRIGEIDSTAQSSRQKIKRQQGQLNKLRYHQKQILSHPGGDNDHDWKKILETVEEMVREGRPPSNRELRDVLVPIVDELPENAEQGPGMRQALRAIDQFMATRPVMQEEAPVPTSPEVEEVANLLEGKTMVLIGGDRRPHAHEALKSAFRLKDLDWVQTPEHESVEVFLPHVANPAATLVVLAIRWSSHSYSEVKKFCDQYDKPLVRLPAGYNPRQMAAQILKQCSEQLRLKKNQERS